MWPFRHMIMCHMFADTEEELEEMRRKLGLRREWRQGAETWKEMTRIGDIVHYDIAKSKRKLAIQYGAIALDDIYAEAEALERVCP